MSKSFDRSGTLSYCIIILLGALTFSEAIRHPFFIVDDPSYVTSNPMVRMGFSLEGLKWSMTSPFYGYFAPLTWLSHTLDIELYGMWAGGHHLTSLLLHLCSTIFLFEALRLMTGSKEKSLLVSLLFLLHPLQVEAVSWVASRKDVLCGFFANFTLYLYARNISSPSKLGNIGIYVTFLCGLLSKTAIVTLPFVLFLFDIWPLKRVNASWSSIKRALLNKLPLLLLALPFVVFSFRAQNQLGALNLIDAGDISARITKASAHFGFYISKYFYPVNLGFPYPRIDITSYPITFFICIFLIGSLISLLSLKNKRAVFVGFAVFLVSLFPFIQMIPVGIQSVSDRWMYLPQIGLSIATIWGISSLIGEARQGLVIKYTLSLAACVLLIKLSVQQIQHWSSDEEMFSHVLAIETGNPAAHTYMANVIASPKTWEKTLPHLKAALDFDPTYAAASERLIKVYQQLEKWPELLEYARTTEKRGSYHADLSYAKKQLLVSRALPPALEEEQNRLLNEALTAFEKLSLDYPDSPAVLAGHAEALVRAGKIEVAKEKMNRAITITSGGDGMSQTILAQWLQQTGEIERADQLLREALWNRPTLQDAYFMLAENLTIQKKYGEAHEFLDKLLLIEPRHIRALLLSADLCFRRGSPKESIKYFDTILAFDPNMPDALTGKTAALKAAQQ